MKVIKKYCLQCQSVFIVQCNPHQQYCNHRVCQKKRQNQWRQQKRQQDADYRENQRVANRNWRKKNAHYWRQYRETHTPYVVKNREQQRRRDQPLPNHPAEGTRHPRLANSDALSNNNFIQSGTYELMPVMANLANSDALRVKITLISTG